MRRLDRVNKDLAAGLLPFDAADGSASPRRLRILWLENTLDCRMWAYYCDIRAAMARLHELCTPHGREMCHASSRPSGLAMK